MERRLRTPTRSEWKAALTRTGVFMLVFLGSAALLFGLDVPAGWLFWLVVSVLSIGWLVRWHTRSFGYECASCSYAFSISPWRNLISPNAIGKAGPRKYLRCPNCGNRAWTPVRVLIEQT